MEETPLQMVRARRLARPMAPTPAQPGEELQSNSWQAYLNGSESAYSEYHLLHSRGACLEGPPGNSKAQSRNLRFRRHGGKGVL